MGDIFRHAKSTVLWLGVPSTDSACGTRTLFQLKDIKLEDYVWDSQRLKAVKSILQRPYWKRIWILQEALCSKDVFVRCGFDEINFERFLDLVRLLPSYQLQALEDSEQIDLTEYFPFASVLDFVNQEQLLQLRQGDSNIGLIVWLYACSGFASTLLRDRIFGPLGLTALLDRDALIPDYSSRTTDQQILCRVTHHLMKTQNKVHEMLVLNFFQDQKNVVLPSWTPDWLSGSVMLPLYQPNRSFSAAQNEDEWTRLTEFIGGLSPSFLFSSVTRLRDSPYTGSFYRCYHESLPLSFSNVGRTGSSTHTEFPPVLEISSI